MTRERDGSLALAGSGTLVDWVVEIVLLDGRPTCSMASRQVRDAINTAGSEA